MLYEPGLYVFGGLLGDLLVEINDGEGVGSRLDEGSGHQVSQSSSGAGHDADLSSQGERLECPAPVPPYTWSSGAVSVIIWITLVDVDIVLDDGILGLSILSL